MNGQTPSHFLSASAYLFEGLKVPTDAQVAEFEADLAEEMSDVEDDALVNYPPPVAGVPFDNSNKCKICLVNPPQVLTLPCRHCAMCSVCNGHLQDRRCIYCRAIILEDMVIFVCCDIIIIH